ncbi:alpha/beta fold hydrolase [Chitinimonas lacunae]|uniref:Alpha/beta fold hydrolase n=1 Tax=Chitinimonas lacunae TaxID=1963018 RepID=A0ABV8MLA8_9NEIS
MVQTASLDEAVEQESLFIDVDGGDRLHLRRIRTGSAGPALLLIHGAISNGRVFYSERGRGLGPWLARRGYDVFVLDLRGRGRSEPSIDRRSAHGQTEAITIDLPAAFGLIETLRPAAPLGCVAHSWGGVYLSSCLARRPELARRVAASVYLGSKRSIRVRNWRRLLEIDLIWQRAASWIVRRHGYLDAARYRIGMEAETAKSLRQSQEWVRAKDWRDSDDGFDYAAALKQQCLPPTLYLAGRADPCRGHADDVARFIAESGPHLHRLQLLGRNEGLSRDYGHVDMLTSEAAEREVYPLIVQWLDDHLEQLTGK